MDLVEVGQPDVTLFAIIIGKQAIHCRVGGSRTENQPGPFDGLVRVAVVHQPAGRPAAQVQVKRVTFELAGHIGKLGFILANLVKCAPFGIGLCRFPLPGQDEHALVAVAIIKRVGLHGTVKVCQRRVYVILANLRGGPGPQHNRVVRSQGQGSVKVGDRCLVISPLQRILSSTQEGQHVAGIVFQVPRVLRGCLVVAVIQPQRISQPQPCLVKIWIAVQGGAIVRDDDIGIGTVAKVDLSLQKIGPRRSSGHSPSHRSRISAARPRRNSLR